MLKAIIKHKYYPGLLLIALIVSLFSFPEIDLEYSTGIDPPLKWLYNHLFSEGLSAGRSIIFPHGPLAFFMYPLAPNFILSVTVTVLLQVIFVFQLFQLIGNRKWPYWMLTSGIAWFIFSISNFNQFILSNISVSFLLYLKNGKSAFKYWGFVLTAFAFYVKAYVAIISGALAFSLLALDFIRTKSYKSSIKDILILLFSMLAFWLAMYGSPYGFIHYCIGMFHLAGDNSAAAAYYPNNNWLFILPFLLAISVIPLLQKTTEGKMFAFLFLPAFFAAWKYGMAREDFFHVQTFLFFAGASLLLFLAYNRKNLVINTITLLSAFALFTANMKNLENRQPLTINYSGIANFVTFVSDYSEIKARSEELNKKNIESNRLPESARNQIGRATVDVYPWDYTVVAANQLNWKTRPVIQSYAAYTSWLDKKNAVHFSSKNAPEFVVFGLNNVTSNLNGGRLESIDNRYLLNDEPQTMLELLKHYERTYYNNDFLVYQKRRQPMEVHSEISKTQSAKWQQWITVRGQKNQFMRMKLHLDRSFPGKIKSFLFKDELYYIYLKTLSGSLLKYRIVPQNASDGLWIAPFYTSAGDRSPSEIITEVLLTCSDKRMVRNDFSFEWEYFDTSTKTIADFLGKDSIMIQTTVVNEHLNLESINPNWNGFNKEKVIDNTTDHEKYYLVAPKEFSPSFKLKIDSMQLSPTRVTVDCWIKATRSSRSTLVIETENATSEKIWHGTDVNNQIIDPDEMNHIFSYQDFTAPAKTITVYVWNNGDEPVLIREITGKLFSN